MSKKYSLLFCLFIAATFTAYAQSPTLNGVYVGAELYTTPFQGMQINNIVIYFKNNGTFNNTLNQTDWKTKVSGAYTITNNMVHLAFKNGDEGKKYKLAANGNLESTAGIKHTLHKVKKVTILPAASYEKRTASTSGGMGTGMPAVGAFSSDFLYFDGKGNFSADRSSIVGITGDAAGGTVGGKFEKNGKSSGTYKLGDGEITLTFGNGTVAKHSFFYSPPNEEDLILLDGEFYFREDEKEKSVTTQQVTRDTRPQTNAPATTGLPTPADLLTKLRAQYGGESIDKITTIKETATITGNIQAIVLTDIANNRIRAELSQNGKLLLVKQLDGNNGWQWLRGTKKALSQDEKDELMISLYQSILGLHKKLSSSFLTGTVAASGDDYIVTFYRNKNKLVYLIGSDYTIKGNAYNINASAPNISVYKDFTKVNGITYPAITESTDGRTKITTTTTSIEFNPVLTDDAWKIPVY
ncbi:hypothetical protein SNE25_24310 [Mucilaginibacter sabulilitoris]|uniref:Lipocalin-like domain-containing protein n=1 Tax=Mucilaginibacter sabulilitoris TaxID=1173583 RepID=A0ABZ0TMQ3_9SPHI|nr:hypothetical protein [Mucilaginibacter sabulilitoris]WPU92455.1 hypothetical protein SNE25_24310 [Mucilaginibacter sabulilitoris]